MVVNSLFLYNSVLLKKNYNIILRYIQGIWNWKLKFKCLNYIYWKKLLAIWLELSSTSVTFFRIIPDCIASNFSNLLWNWIVPLQILWIFRFNQKFFVDKHFLYVIVYFYISYFLYPRIFGSYQFVVHVKKTF